MQEQEPSVNDILSSIRQILSNKIEDENTETQNVDEPNGISATAVDEQEQALMQATDVYVLMPNMRVAQEGGAQPSEPVKPASAQSLSSGDMPYEQPMIVDTPKSSEQKTPAEPQLTYGKGETPAQTQPMNASIPDMCETDVKPMIQEWLDKNLPALVERIVAEEVRRIFNKR